ncbi:MAG: hypothetical protein KC414_10730, partial [Romboutsia sp.]|nr:hypothetical protein [Romboutsia sp.]
MPIYKIYPTKDAAIYSLYPNMNSGRDEIIEMSTTVTSDYSTNPQASRALLEFSSDEITDIINNKIGNNTWDVNLRIYAATITGLKNDSIITIAPVSGSWSMGTGKYLDSPQTMDGVSWIWMDYSGSRMWDTNSASFASNVTASWGNTLGGGTFYSASSGFYYSTPITKSYTFYGDKDINLSVKNIVNLWYSGSISNDGFIIYQNQEFTDS